MKQSILLFIIIVTLLLSSLPAVSFRFIALADSRGSSNGVNVSEVQTILSRITTLSPQPLFIVSAGDLVSGYASSSATYASEFATWKSTVSAFYPITQFYPVVGNHDTGDGDAYGEYAFGGAFTEFQADNFLAGYDRTVYSFDTFNCRFIMVNSNHPGNDHIIDATQRTWLTSQLSGKTHYFVFFHEPAYPTGPHVGSSLDVSPTDRDAFWQILDNANVSIVFDGHEHCYTRRHINNAINANYKNNIYQVTTGTFGAPFESGYSSTTNVDVAPTKVYHYAVVDVNDNTVTTTVYQDNGTQLDSFVVTRGITSTDDWQIFK